jgi:hypothetical protein
MWRAFGALIAALILWTVVATAGHRLACGLWPGYATGTPLLSFTLPMKIFRLSLGAFSTLAAGAVARRISPARWIPVALGCVLVVLFLPEHYKLWYRFPVWYHLAFLCTLIPLAVIGARLPRVLPARNIGRNPVGRQKKQSARYWDWQHDSDRQ